MTEDQQPAVVDEPVINYNDPTSVEQAIVRIHGQIHRGVDYIAGLNGEHKRLDRQLAKERAEAFLDYIGTQQDKRHAAELATQDRRQEVDEAKVLLDYARDRMRELEKTMSGLQSILSDLRALYNAERGRG